jgi:formyltetrahydrofolate hydrolase
MRHTACLLVSCPDRKGLVAAIANFLYSHSANILPAFHGAKPYQRAFERVLVYGNKTVVLD